MQKIWLLVAALLAMVAQPVLANEIGRIKNVTASGVNVIRGGESQPARSGFKLVEGDIVETTARGRVGITFVDDTRISIAESSRMIISKYRFNRSNFNDANNASDMTVERGAVGVDSGNLSGSGNMRFHTPNSTLGVRGTTFVIEVDE
ncbi:hypothetical protein CD351_13250 [Erythrobacter sp. KY5]|uniref:FecR family protein n=1 Tax=Erythrobacter sp. KY5 TaxID=2011159 RepID=UPI000DBEF73F|nr:FecR domain-containing protein [Erythrobacter sp. KY5]AWW75397.1 hypothetical protein CD351_13250 [Erythrobacter sp. KY5]